MIPTSRFIFFILIKAISPTPNAESNPGKGTRTLEGGLKVTDIKVGHGTVAENGKWLKVYYVGKLESNNKQFDALQEDPPFEFQLGKGSVIKGWEVGLVGMKVGGKRKLIIPPEMAYGKKGAPPNIPPDATLIFIVDLKSVS